MKKILIILPIIVIPVIGIRLFIFSIWSVPGKVMYPLVHSGQKVLVLQKKWFKPKRGDVIIIRDLKRDRSYIRRIISVGGDVISIKENSVILHGRKLDEPYKFIAKNDSVTYPEIYQLKIRQGDFFMMGDNRNARSDFDSRVNSTISENQIVGKIVYIF